MLYWQIRRMVLDHDDANDILQDTFIKAWNGIEEFEGRSQVRTWLYRIALNETLNFLSKKHQKESLDNVENVAATLEGDPYFDGDKTQILLQEAIAQLPDKQRMVFNLKYFDELKYEEMSEMLGTSVGALKASYHIAVKKICSFIEKKD